MTPRIHMRIFCLNKYKYYITYLIILKFQPQIYKKCPASQQDIEKNNSICYVVQNYIIKMEL